MQEAWAKARAAEDMAWFQPLPTPSQRSGLSEAVKSTMGTHAPPHPLRDGQEKKWLFRQLGITNRVFS
jgi:hypothetical protein